MSVIDDPVRWFLFYFVVLGILLFTAGTLWISFLIKHLLEIEWDKKEKRRLYLDWSDAYRFGYRDGLLGKEKERFFSRIWDSLHLDGCSLFVLTDGYERGYLDASVWHNQNRVDCFEEFGEEVPDGMACAEKVFHKKWSQ